MQQIYINKGIDPTQYPSPHGDEMQLSMTLVHLVIFSSIRPRMGMRCNTLYQPIGKTHMAYPSSHGDEMQLIGGFKHG